MVVGCCYHALRCCIACLQEAVVPLNDVAVTQVVHTVPAIDFDVTAAAASADGHQLLLVGITTQVRRESSSTCSTSSKGEP